MQDRAAEFERHGLQVFAISYDAVAVLADFARKRGITYPLLSDEGSRTIRTLGLLNEHLAEQASFYGAVVRDHHHGVPYPGVFVLDESGLIVDKYFEQSYRVRPTASGLAEDVLGETAERQPTHARAERDGVDVVAWLDAPTYRPYQKLRLHVAIRVAPELHVYGTPVPDGYTPLGIDLEPIPDLVVDSVRLPAPRLLRMPDLDEDFYVHEGLIRAVIPFSIQAQHGDVTLKVRVQYQSCSETVCFSPGEVVLDLPLSGLDLIRD